jgi:hypothetical protein
MADEKQEKERVWYEKASDMSKGVRDIIIVLILLTLLLFPGFINNRLIDAGFTNADIAGFQWEKQVLQASEQTGEASRQVGIAEEKLQSVKSELNSLVAESQDPVVRERAASLSNTIDTSIRGVQSVQTDLRASMIAQRSILERVPAQAMSRDAEWGVQLAAVKTAGEAEEYLKEAQSQRLPAQVFEAGDGFHVIVEVDDRESAVKMAEKVERAFTGAFPKNVSDLCKDRKRVEGRDDWWVCR